MESINTSRIIVRNAKKSDWAEAMQLAWDTFQKYDAPDYSDEGINNFKKFINDSVLQKMFLMGNYQMFVAEDAGKIIGILTLRERTHISLLFVDDQYFHHGVGRALVKFMSIYVRDEEGENAVTVNAAPYAIGFYHRLGFVDLSRQIETDGIKFTPMKLVISSTRS